MGSAMSNLSKLSSSTPFPNHRPHGNLCMWPVISLRTKMHSIIHLGVMPALSCPITRVVKGPRLLLFFFFYEFISKSGNKKKCKHHMVVTDMMNSNVFFGIRNTSDSPSEPNSFMYGFADVWDELNFLLGTISTE
jgi:hypothetical protein